MLALAADAALLFSTFTLCCSAVSQASTAGLPGHSLLAHNYSQPAAFGSLPHPTLDSLTQPPPKGDTPRKSQFHNFEMLEKIFCQIPKFLIVCRLPCERRERLRATEVVRVALVPPARPRRRQSPRSRYGGAATASKLPNREFSSGITGAHVTGAERLGDYIREYGIKLDELKIHIFPNRALRVCKHYFNRRGIFFMEIGKWWNGDDIRYLKPPLWGI